MLGARSAGLRPQSSRSSCDCERQAWGRKSGLWRLAFAASVKVLPESETPDVQCVFAPASYRPGLIRKLDDRPGITGGPWQMRPLSRGYVLVRTPDPHDQPAINPRYLAEDADQRAIVGGLRFLRRLFAAPALAKHIIAENLPGPSAQSDDELLDYARSNGSTVYHASCSCMMGNHGMAVVDDQLRVRGLDGVPPERRARAMSAVMAGGVLADVLGPQLVTFTMDLWQPFLFAATFLAQAGVTAVSGGASFRLSRSAPSGHHQVQQPNIRADRC